MEESSKSVMQVEFDIGHMAGVFIVLVFGLAFSVAMKSTKNTDSIIYNKLTRHM
jgi:hypothetical protein